MNANAGYDPRKDFTPIGMIGFAPNVLVVHPSLPVHSVAELIAYAKAAPAPLQYGSPGVGTVNHLAGEYLAQRNRDEASARALQGQRSGHERSARRTYSDDVRSDPGRARQCQGRNLARPRDHQCEAIELAAGFADACRKRRARFRCGPALWARGARRYAARSHCATEQGTQRRARHRGRERIASQRKAPKRCQARRRPTPPISTGTKRSGAGW